MPIDKLGRVRGAAAYDADLHDAGAYAARRATIAALSRAHLVVSTHFDDAALSLAHLLQAPGRSRPS